MCFVWIWEQTAIISLYSIDWLVFITETGCVYCAVRSTFYVLPTQCIYVFCVDLRTNSDYFTVQHWLVGFYNRDGVCLLRGTNCVFKYKPLQSSGHIMYYQFNIHNSTFCPHSVLMCFVWIWEKSMLTLQTYKVTATPQSHCHNIPECLGFTSSGMWRCLSVSRFRRFERQ